MPYDSNGIYSLPPGYLAVDGQTILPSQHNPPLQDIAAALSQVVLRSGVAPMNANLRMNGFKVMGAAAATLPDDLTTKSQLDEAIAGIEANTATFTTLSGAYTALDTDYNKVFRCTSALTLSIEETADLRDNWTVEIWAEGGTVIIDPDGSDTINGSTTLFIQSGQKAVIFRNSSTTFRAFLTGDSLSGPQLQGVRAGLALSNSGSDTANDIVIGVGCAAADSAPYNLMQLLSSLTKRLDALWAVGTNQGGLDTGSVSNSTYYIWLIQRPDTLVTDVLFSLSATSPTMPANYTRKALIGSFLRTSGTNDVPFPIGNVTAVQVAALTATLQRGDVGTYAFLSGSTAATASGSALSYCDSDRATSGQPPAGSVWRRMGYAEFTDRGTVWLRIS